ncbi:putative sulfate exporter family transporter [Streptomyces venezuelae]|uniref:Putative sulfate exporter family transporter n=1 Tax=Streptomyces venezuelae TaxID=54571 RepID=A0A5P2D1Q9_STRVZ|nr:putative sulfate exporter family transporter [Streptomyces venezuelae]QES49084.1 putative sulfate exporter family transporter [Streptomyces venezuelae]
MALLNRQQGAAVRHVSRETPASWPGLATATGGALLAWGVHRLVPAVPLLTASVVLGIAAAHLPRMRTFVRGAARPGLSLAGRRLMRIGIVLLGLGLGLEEVLRLGWAAVAMVLGVVAVTFLGTLWLGRRLGLRGDQPLLIATGYSICGASAIGAVSQVSGSDEEDVASSVALVTLCGTLAIAVLPLLQGPLGLTDLGFGRWVGASVHDVGQVVATAQTSGPAALGEAVLVKLMRVALLAPLVAAVAFALRARRRGERTASGRRPAPVPLFVAGFLMAVALRTTGLVPEVALEWSRTAQEGLLAAALFGLGSAVHLPSLARTGGRAALLGLGAWVVVAGVSYAGVLLTV